MDGATRNGGAGLMADRDSGALTGGTRTALGLLVRVNLLQAWRRVRAIKEQSPVLVALILLFIGGYFWIAFWLFFYAFRFLSSFPGLGPLLAERLLFILFAFLSVLLLLSNLVISYTNLFRNRETVFLRSLPIEKQTIVRWKFLESTLLASWAFLFLISPFLVAYGLIQEVAWHFYPATLFLIVLFVVLPAALGSWLAMNIARYLDRRLFQAAAGALALGLLIWAGWWLQSDPGPDEQETRVLLIMDRLLAKTAFAQFPLLPSYWLASGMIFWSEGAVGTAGFFVLLLTSYVVFFGTLLYTKTGELFDEAFSSAFSRGSLFGYWKGFRRWKSASPPGWARRGLLERLIDFWPGVSRDVAALIVKDVRMFWRDTTQWGQSLVLFGLLGVYILNLRQFSEQLTNPFWIHLVAYLNLAACSLNLATLTTRFVYPQFSLEGKRIWIVGMAPMGLERVVRTKYWLAVTVSLGITLGLVGLSCVMLGMPWGRIGYFALAVTFMSFSLTGLAVGLGVIYPNFREDNPGKIVSGFGGTFCLVLSFVYILGSIILLAIGSPWNYGEKGLLRYALPIWTGFVLLSAAFGVLPLWLGLKRVRTFEL